MANPSPRPCAECEAGAYAGNWPPPERVAVHPDGPSFLHRCDRCGTFWDFDLRKAVLLTEQEAQALYPGFFGR